MFATRSQFNREENLITRALRRRAGGGGSLLDLTVSNPTTAGLAHPVGTLRAMGEDAALHYVPQAQGLLSARQAIADDHARSGAVIAPENLLLASGSSEAYGWLFKLLCEPGDEVLVPQPSYPLLEHLCRFESVRPVPYRLAYDGRFYIDFDHLRAQVSDQTRAVVVVSPNNPTGSFLKMDEAAQLAKVGLPVISDEVFGPFALTTDAGRIPSLVDWQGPLHFSLHGLSKYAGLPQAKLSWIAIGGPSQQVDEARRRLAFIADAYLSVGGPAQQAVPALLSAGRALQPRVITRLRANLAVLRASLDNTSPLSALHVEGGYYAVLRAPRTLSDEQWALSLLDGAGIVVQPGFFYDFPGEGHLVVSLLTPESTFSRGITNMDRIVRLQA